MKRLLLVALVLLLLLVAGAALLLSTLDEDGLGREALARLNQAEGVTLEAESFRFGFFDGLEMRNASGRLRFENATLDLALRSLVLEPELLPLLRRRLVVRRLVLEAPDLRLVSDRPARAGGAGRGDREARRERRRKPQERAAELPASAAPLGAAVAVEVRSLRMVDGSLSLVDAAGATTAIRGLDLELRDLEIEGEEALAGIRGRGSLRAAQLESGDLTATALSAELEAGDGRLLLTELGFSTPSAEVRGASLTTDLTQVPYTYELAAAGAMDLDVFLSGSGAAEGGKAGPATVRLDVTGVGPDAERVRGSGSVRLEPGAFPAPPLIRQIESVVGEALLSGRPYEAVEIPFSIDGERVEVGDFELVSQDLTLGGAGRIDLSGPLAMRLRLTAPRAGIKADSLGSDVLDGLTGADGRVALPLRVRGSLESPRVEPDLDALSGQVIDKARDAAEEEFGKLGRDLLDKLLDRNR